MAGAGSDMEEGELGSSPAIHSVPETSTHRCFAVVIVNVLGSVIESPVSGREQPLVWDCASHAGRQ